MFYCFNENCNKWGEAVNVGVVATWPQPAMAPNSCHECGGNLYFHDTWDGNRRLSDQGEKVTQ